MEKRGRNIQHFINISTFYMLEDVYVVAVMEIVIVLGF